MNPAEQFELIVREHYEPLFRFALSLTRASAEAEDLTQQTFYVWATKGHQLRDGAKVKTWLFTTLHRLFLKSRRRQALFPEVVPEDVPEPVAEESPHLGQGADGVQVLSALARVDESYRAAVALFYLEDYSYKEIAAILDVPVGTVKSRIARGIAHLRTLLPWEPPRSPSPDPDRSRSSTAGPRSSETSVPAGLASTRPPACDQAADGPLGPDFVGNFPPRSASHRSAVVITGTVDTPLGPRPPTPVPG